MATRNTLDLAARLCKQLDTNQSQGSLASQAEDCAPIVEALGYYDLADHLRRIARPHGQRLDHTVD